MNPDPPTTPQPAVADQGHYLDRFATPSHGVAWPVRLIGGGLAAATVLLIVLKVLAGQLVAGATGPSWWRIGVSGTAAVLVLAEGLLARGRTGHLVTSGVAVIVLLVALYLAWWR